jgi:ABC-type sugar transport system substrate-binding protein
MLPTVCRGRVLADGDQAGARRALLASVAAVALALIAACSNGGGAANAARPDKPVLNVAVVPAVDSAGFFVALDPGFDSWAGFLGCGWDDGAGQRVSASGKPWNGLVTRSRQLQCVYLGK